MNITFLGSSSREMINRGCVSFLVEEEDSNLLVDCGPSIISNLQKANKRPSDINNLVITHVHGDHISSFAYFVWYRNIERMGEKPAGDLNVYGQKDVLELAKYNVEHMYQPSKWPFKIIYHDISENSDFECNLLKIETFKVTHSAPCIGLSILASDKKIIYSSDTLPDEELLKYSKNTDILIHEGMLLEEEVELSRKIKHSTGKDAGKVAKIVNPKMLLLVHINPDVYGKENQLIKEAKEEFDGIISIPTEGAIYNI